MRRVGGDDERGLPARGVARSERGRERGLADAALAPEHDVPPAVVVGGSKRSGRGRRRRRRRRAEEEEEEEGEDAPPPVSAARNHNLVEIPGAPDQVPEVAKRGEAPHLQVEHGARRPRQSGDPALIGIQQRQGPFLVPHPGSTKASPSPAETIWLTTIRLQGTPSALRAASSLRDSETASCVGTVAMTNSVCFGSRKSLPATCTLARSFSIAATASSCCSAAPNRERRADPAEASLRRRLAALRRAASTKSGTPRRRRVWPD